MDIVFDRVAGLDIGKASLTVVRAHTRGPARDQAQGDPDV